MQTHLRFLGLPTSRVEAQNSLNYIYIHPPLLYFVEDCISWIFMYTLITLKGSRLSERYVSESKMQVYHLFSFSPNQPF